MGPSKSYYSIPLEKILIEEIIEEDLSRGLKDRKHYYIADEEDLGLEEGVDPESTPSICQYLKLTQRQVQAPRVLHEPLVDYSLSQVLTSNAHIESMEEFAQKKAIVT